MTLAVKALAQAAIHDPVCVMEVDPAQAARAIERDGKTEYLPISYGLRRLNGREWLVKRHGHRTPSQVRAIA
jgi:hypothetical protein